MAVVAVSGLDHIVFNVADVEKSVRWYGEMLGLEPVRLEEWRRGEAPFASVRVDGGTIIDLVKAERSGENVNHVCLTVDDSVDLDELAEGGRFDVVRPPAKLFGAQGWGRGFYVRDPDGNVVELRNYRLAREGESR